MSSKIDFKNDSEVRKVHMCGETRMEKSTRVKTPGHFERKEKEAPCALKKVNCKTIMEAHFANLKPAWAT